MQHLGYTGASKCNFPNIIIHKFNIVDHSFVNGTSAYSGSRCCLSRDLLICQSNKDLHSIKFTSKDSKPSLSELAQTIAQVQPVRSGDKGGVIVNFNQAGSEESSQVVLFSEQGQASVKCRTLSHSAQWVFYDSTRETPLLLQLVPNNQVRKFSHHFQ